MSKASGWAAAERARRKREQESARQKRARYDCRTLDGAINFLTRKKLTRYLSRYSILRTAKMLRITPHRVRRLARKHGIPLRTSRPFPKAMDAMGMHGLRQALHCATQEPLAGTETKDLATCDPLTANADTRVIASLSKEAPATISDRGSTPDTLISDVGEKEPVPSAPVEPAPMPAYAPLPTLEERRRNLENYRRAMEQHEARCRAEEIPEIMRPMKWRRKL